MDSQTSTGESDAEPGQPDPKKAKRRKKGESRRTPRNIKTAARLLQREARRILSRHRRKLSPEVVEAIRASVAAIDDHREKEDWVKLEAEAEALDELLHQHASFARKSALRETLENIAIAVVVALGLRSCFYEPFKIPSGSMMPTLRAGDHIFVNKFAYGIQIPLTTTIVAKDWLDHIDRGDVVVFRYPLDTKEDFIKRVMALPGDTVRVEDDRVYIKRSGEDEFDKVPRKRLETPCLNDAGTEVVETCVLYEETQGEHTYVVRYVGVSDMRVNEHPRELTVPEGHLLVMGDNRKMSHDSLQWMASVEAVAADGLLSVKDLRDLTAERLFTLRHPGDAQENQDPNYDQIMYLADHRSPESSLQLEVWRDPQFGARAVFEGLAAAQTATREASIAELLVTARDLDATERARMLEVGGGIDDLRLVEGETATDVVWLLEPAKTVFRLHCGLRACADPASVARRVTDVVARFETDHDQDARELIEGDESVRYTQHWRSRDDVADRYFETVYRRPGDQPVATGGAGEVRLRVWRHPEEKLDVLRDAALMSFGSSRDDAEAVAELGEDAWLWKGEGAFRYVVVDRVNEMFAVLECGTDHCTKVEDAMELALSLVQKLPAASDSRRRMPELIAKADMGDWAESPVALPDDYAWDRVSLDGSIRGGEHSITLEVARKPSEGHAALISKWRNQMPRAQQLDTIADGGFISVTKNEIEHVFYVRETDTVIRLSCAPGLCADRKAADAIAERVAEKTLDPENFIDPDAKRPQPFVPRGHVKGRAERIWYPFKRFWLRIR